MLRIDDPSLQQTFDKLSAACRRRMKELLAPLEREFDHAVISDVSIDLMSTLLREGYKLQKLSRACIMDVLLRLQFEIFPVTEHLTYERVDDPNVSAIQRRFNAEVADCTEKLATVTEIVMSQTFVPVAVNALFVLANTHIVAALENGLITQQMAREFCEQMRNALLPQEERKSLN